MQFFLRNVQYNMLFKYNMKWNSREQPAELTQKLAIEIKTPHS